MSARRSSLPFPGIGEWFNVAAGLRWWGRGLLLWLTPALRRLLYSEPARLVIDIAAEEVVISEEHYERSTEVERVDHDSLDSGRLTLPRIGERVLVLRLPSDLVLSRETTLPLAAAHNVHEVVGYEIDRLTPFPADKLYYDVEVIDKDVQGKTLLVRFTAVMRQLLDQRLEQLKQVGVVPDIVEVQNMAINLMPASQRPRRGRPGQILRGLLVVLVVFTALAVALIPIWQQRALAIQLLPQVDSAQVQAEEVSRLRTNLEETVASSRFLLEKRNANSPVLDLLNELTSILPDNTWVEQLIIKDGEVQVRGQSRDATALIGIVESSEFFSQATFRSPVTPDRRTGADRFFLVARINAGIRRNDSLTSDDAS